MRISLLRQAIYNEDFVPVGYELLHGQELDPASAPAYTSEDSLICRILTNAFFGFDREELSGGRPLYVSVTNMLLTDGLVELYPPDRFVVEVPPNLFLDQSLADCVSLLHRRGYRLSLKCYTPMVERSRNLQYLNMFEEVRVDVGSYNRLRVKEFVKLLRRYRVRITAENIDSPEALSFAREEGFDYYQGSVFGGTVELNGSVSMRKVPYGKLFNHLLTGRVNRRLCGSIIMEDPALMHMFLRKAFNNLHNRKVPDVEVERGLAWLDDDQLRHWAAVLLLDQASQNALDETVPQVFRRGLFMERLTSEANLDVPPGRAFMFGVASALDRVFGEDMETVVKQLALGDKMRNALLDIERNDYELLLRAARAYEEKPEAPQLPPAFSSLGQECMARILWDCQVNTEYIIRALEYTVPAVYQGNILQRPL